mgnify:CR=1 FL=1
MTKVMTVEVPEADIVHTVSSCIALRVALVGSLETLLRDSFHEAKGDDGTDEDAVQLFRLKAKELGGGLKKFRIDVRKAESNEFCQDDECD